MMWIFHTTLNVIKQKYKDNLDRPALFLDDNEQRVACDQLI